MPAAMSANANAETPRRKPRGRGSRGQRAHPVNRDGPWRGWSTGGAGAVAERHRLGVGGVFERDVRVDLVGAGCGRTNIWNGALLRLAIACRPC